MFAAPLRIALCALTAAAVLSPAASAQVTVGAPLNLPANVAAGCEDTVLPPLRPVIGVPATCTYWGLDSAGSWTSQTPRGGWRIVRARVRTGPRVGPMAFTVIRAMRSQAGTVDNGGPAGIICCTAPFESQVFVPQPNTVNEIPVNLPVVNTVEVIDGEPVEVVDYLGITLLSLDSSLPLHAAAGSSSTGSFIAPGIRAGGQSLVSGPFANRVVLVNADYVAEGAGQPRQVAPLPIGPPSNAFTLQPGVRLLRSGNAARLGLGLPGAGVLRAASPARAAAARADAAANRKRGKAKRRGKPLLRPSTLHVESAGPVKISVRLTRAGRKLRARRGRLRIPITLTFTPTGGAPATKTRRVTFAKPKRKAKGKRGRPKARARSASVTSAGAYRKPASGKWSIQNMFGYTAGGTMTIARKGGKVTKLVLIVGEDHVEQCGAERVRLVSKPKVKRFPKSGDRWGVARYETSSLLGPRGVKLRVGGKQVRGKLMLLFDESGRLADSARAQFGDCSLSFAARK